MKVFECDSLCWVDNEVADSDKDRPTEDSPSLALLKATNLVSLTSKLVESVVPTVGGAKLVKVEL